MFSNYMIKKIETTRTVLLLIFLTWLVQMFQVSTMIENHAAIFTHKMHESTRVKAEL